MENYTATLIDYDFLKTNTEAAWIAAPLIVPKPPPANFRLTVDLRPIKASKKPMVWPMPNMDAETGDMQGIKFFSGIHFVCGYWQMPLEEKIKPIHAFMTSNAVLQPARTQQGFATVVPTFKEKSNPASPSFDNGLKHGSTTSRCTLKPNRNY